MAVPRIAAISMGMDIRLPMGMFEFPLDEGDGIGVEDVIDMGDKENVVAAAGFFSTTEEIIV
jgi:hypothetical protein